MCILPRRTEDFRRGTASQAAGAEAKLPEKSKFRFPPANHGLYGRRLSYMAAMPRIFRAIFARMRGGARHSH